METRLKIRVQAYAALGEIIGSTKVDVETSAQTVGDLIDVLTVTYGAAFQAHVIDAQTKTLRRSYRILVNGRNIETLTRLQTPLQDGDIVYFFPPVAGG